MSNKTHPDLFQGNVINNLNEYLRWNNLPLHMNENGICHGLASVYAKYVLEGKQKEFLQMLAFIAGTTPPKTLELKLNHFVVELVESFDPKLYNKSLTQVRSMQTLDIEGKPLKPSFSLAMVTSKKNWAHVFNDVQLQENEVLRLSSHNHTVTLTKKEGKYYLYDPNYSSGLKTFSDEKALVQELYAHVFYFSYRLGPASMHLQVIKNPHDLAERAAPFPEKKAFYEKYLPVVHPAKIALLKWVENHTKWYEKYLSANHKMLTWAATCEDQALVEYLLAKGVKDRTHEALDNALRANDRESIQTIIEHSKPSTDCLKKRLYFTLFGGYETSFETISAALGPDALTDLLKSISIKDAFKAAARGGNFTLLKKVMAHCSPNLNSYQLAAHVISDDKDAIFYAIKSRSSKCVRLLLATVSGAHGKIDDKKLLQYIVKAIKGNQRHMVSLLLERASDDLVSTVTLSPKAVEQTDLAILYYLKRRGVTFSPLADAMINIKAHRPVGILLSIGIMLYKFTDFLAFMQSKRSRVTYSAEKFGLFQANKAQQTAPPVITLEDFLRGTLTKNDANKINTV